MDARRRLHVLFALPASERWPPPLLMALPGARTATPRAPTTAPTRRAQALLRRRHHRPRAGAVAGGSAAAWFTRSASVLAVVGISRHGRPVGHDVGDLDVRLQRRLPAGQPGGGAVVLCCAVAPRSLAVRLFELPPLPQSGRISYGVYLWYWPVLLVMTGQRLHWGVYPLFLARVGITVAIAAISYDLVEMPIRRGALPAWRSWSPPPSAPPRPSARCSSARWSRWARRSSRARSSVTAAPSTTSTAAPAAVTQSGHTAVPIPDDSTTRRLDDAAPTRRRPRPAPTFLSPALPVVTSARPVKVLLVGDSVAGTLGVGLAAQARQYGVQIANEGTPGCSLSMQSQIRVLFYTVSPQAPCDVDETPTRCSTPGRGGWTPTTPTSSSTSPAARRSTRTVGGTVAEPRPARLRPLRGRAATARPPPFSVPRVPASCS